MSPARSRPEAVTAARRAALAIALDVGRGLRLDVALERGASGLEARDRAFLHELSYGASRLRGRLDHLLAARVRGGLERLEPAVREILRLGAYQVLCMDGVPRYAAVSQAVSQARSASGRGAAGLVNALLRAVAVDGGGLERFPDFGQDPEGFLASWGSHPAWLLRRWLARWSPGEVRALVEADNRRPSLYLVPLHASPAEAARILEARGIASAPVGKGTLCLELAPGSSPAAALEALPSLVQDPAAHLVTRYADIPPGTMVADLCAAPGGKALALAVRGGYTLAADRSEVRMRRLRDNARRTGLGLGMVVADARRPPLASADAVVLDVPCTGTGTLGRHPDARWRLDAGAMDEMIRLQREILDAAVRLVPRGGLLVYSTCTLEPEENQGQVEAFLAGHPGFGLEPTGAVASDYLDADGYLVVLPQRHGFDGAFAARLRRAS
ncbi:MAG TPA: transcription antitermination factor NusB [Longimicrobiales bacterium]|nr:transcription antitermination factor NusB [Longimicrobiales bacterium]